MAASRRFFNTRLPQRKIDQTNYPLFSFQILTKVVKEGMKGIILSSIILYNIDAAEQNNYRRKLERIPSKDKYNVEPNIAIDEELLDDTPYDETILQKKYGEEGLVYFGGAQKEGFNDIIYESTQNKRLAAHALTSDEVTHCAIAIMPVNPASKKPLILGRQSPSGPIKTLAKSIRAGWQQFKNPQEQKSIQGVMRSAMKTVIANEKEHLTPSAAFDVKMIKDTPIPIGIVQKNLVRAQQDLNLVMNFYQSNCMTTKAYVTLQTALDVEKWEASGAYNAPNSKQVDAFMLGCVDIIKGDIGSRLGYGVLNNPKIQPLINEVYETLEARGLTTQKKGEWQQTETAEAMLTMPL